uniref:Vesicle-associated membrane protein-associated protein A n=1 Tax=Cacopsylla melanoneura TaxID=428564 RepID=A0A8D8XY64_9HEMI
MSRPEQPLVIDPPTDLKFKGPFTKPVSSYLKLTNPNDHRVCFKIKTTAPRRYCVRPNSGFIDPKSSVEIAVTLQPFSYDINEKNKHKFMVQSISAPDDEVNVEALWKEVDPCSIMEYKLRCVFENPVENSQEGGSESFPPVYPEDKAKRIPEQNAGPDGELAKAAQEVNSSREEESALRQENLELKEELLRLRYRQQASDQHPTQGRANGDTGDISLTMIVALAIFTAILGIALGKFIL